MSTIYFTFGIGVLSLIGIFLGVAVVIYTFHRKVEQGKALIANKLTKEPVVSFTGMLVLPVIHKSEIMDISLKTIVIDRRGNEGLICSDNIRADIKVAFFVRVNKTQEDVLKVAQAIGCRRASDQETLEELFSAKFSEALKTVGKQMDFEDLYKERDSFRDRIIQLIGKDLNGYVLEDAAIDFLEQTPITVLDPKNILDSQGIRKITELTTEQMVMTNELDKNGEMRITKKNVEAREAILELERQLEDAEAKQGREVSSIQARETAATEIVQAEERQKSESARITADQAIAVAEENHQREVQVAEKNRERVLAVETEKVERARAMEAISREREVELTRIAKEKALEEERKAIADVIRERIAVDKTVAQEEENIKELRLVSEADRERQASVIMAEAEAQQKLVADLKAAEAAEQAARHHAQERLTLADADLAIAEKEAQAQMRRAEGLQAETAAPGLAQAQVDEASAVALEKKGKAEAAAMLAQRQAEAQGAEQVGLAEARVKDVGADALKKEGAAQAEVERERLLAIAAGEEAQGMATVKVKEADAEAYAKQAAAEAEAIRQKMVAEAEGIKQKLLAEAAGLADKFTAMQTLGDAGREFEEFRLKLEQSLKIQMESIGAQRDIAKEQASVLGEAFKNATIDIVGGDGTFFDNVMRAITTGKSLDKGLQHSEAARTLLGDYLDGDSSLVADVKEILTRPAMSGQDVQNLTLAAFLSYLMAKGEGDQQAKVQELLETAKRLGIDKLR